MAYYEEHSGSGYDLVYYQDSVSFSDYDEPKFINYDDYHNDYDYSYVNYFAYNFAEPKLIAYEPVACDTGYVSYHMQHSISYSTTDDTGFNEPEFEAYDPTPYGGGYDIVSHYGKPLPPSDQTCYPRSNPKPSQSKPEPKPMAKVEPEPKPNPMPIQAEPEPKPKPIAEPEPVFVPTHVSFVEPEPLREPEPSYGYDYPWPEYDNGVGYDYGYYGKQVVQVPPCEYDPEVVDFCENIFGSWPCLARTRKQQMGIDNNQGLIATNNHGSRPQNPWEACANYIFGGPTVSYDQ